jgi:hypothetical protein
MFRKLLWTAVAAVALIAPLALAGSASAHDIHHDRRVVVRRDWHPERRAVQTVTTVRTVVTTTRTVGIRR